ncbi:programmed cell death protein 2-like [Homalodisca vitripennis]|uniref:programmed cell death protein 2-like n=1 Tax=Homalodisca vitripennis TaxID=197043 RepID=UPI001EEB182B|nr:programmed cell death protein 2-like [Homalodisca vitripennis]
MIMAKSKPKVYIGFEDELITQKHLPAVTFTTNKVGGKPDWIGGKSVNINPLCQRCGTIMPLIVQVYAPLVNSFYHRTLYLFGCINPNCWNLNESWVCMRGQMLDTNTVEVEKSKKLTAESFDWCGGADVWEDEENGNVCGTTKVDKFMQKSEELSDMLAAMEFDNGEDVGATGHPFSPMPTAEIDGGEDEVVTIETPTVAETDMMALFDQAKPVPEVPPGTLEFASFFLSVCEEDEGKPSIPVNAEFNPQLYDEECNSAVEQSSVGDNAEVSEKYEKSLPAHGDKLFHTFISRIKRNPGQILRYIREGGMPLLLYPISKMPQECKYCGGDLVFELQLVPTMISSLRLIGSGHGHMEFGTVLVLACQRSCWDPQTTERYEYVIVQRET